ncbi:hypothetical protein POM88_028163 [Heracleum sosnowskyi]|uniref:Uncharacterized protein n=1 Tax=Heracleum sosnowskyi TaxID=360622 RepID=A0AAD8IAD4_9APIA|nr:hypothetical protein POM88_028163 [Heracleum sosnowskyi]
MMESYRVMLYIKSAVTRNYSEKCLNSIMDFVSGSASQNFGLLQEFYQTTLKALEEAKNERLWLKTNMKLCKIWFDMGEYGRMNKTRCGGIRRWCGDRNLWRIDCSGGFGAVAVVIVLVVVAVLLMVVTVVVVVSGNSGGCGGGGDIDDDGDNSDGYR